MKKEKIITRQFHYTIDYQNSYGELSPFFKALGEKKIKGTRCSLCKMTWATPRSHCPSCGSKLKWVELPQEGTVHTWTTCYYGSEEFLKQTPYHLILVQFPKVDSLFLSQLRIGKQDKITIGMKVKAKFKQNQNLTVADIYFVPA